ncbi:efflux RND transporter periplasmic adaptor subunit [Oscillospiraceae bacterium NTUH-002-81]|nr:efflux RND transporter periplasmic adaptor subunit [Oscillospiraceae bacterium NTUH-002-81]
MKNRRVLALGLVIVLGVSITGCSSKKQTEETAEKVNVEVQPPGSGEVALDTDYIGTVSPEQQVYVTPLVSGTVTQVNYAVGDTVQEGDVLFKIDDEAAQLQMSSAKAAYSQAAAGVTAATGGSRHLQNYQTEQSIDTLEDSLDKVRSSISDMQGQIDTLGQQQEQLTAAVQGAQGAVSTQETALIDAKAELQRIKEEAGVLKADGSDDQDVLKTLDDATRLAIETQANTVSKADLALQQAKGALSDAQSGLSQVTSGKSQLESALETAKSQKETLKDNLKTAQETYDITQDEVYPQTDATYAAQLAQAGVGVKSARYQLDFYTVTAPISGQVETVSVEKDAMAAAGNVAFVISNKNSMTVTFQVAEKVKDQLQVGDAITVERGDETFGGTITEVGTMAGAQTRLFQIKATIPGVSDKLPSGVSVKVHATTQREEGDLIIPYDAVYFSAGDAYVYCVEDGKLVKTPVTVGLMNDTQVSIADGLTADSQVVTTWSSKLRDGAEVTIVSGADSTDGSNTASTDSADSSNAATTDRDTTADNAAGDAATGDTDNSNAAAGTGTDDSNSDRKDAEAGE